MDFQSGLFLYIIIIFSAIIHEYAHGWMALRQGDPTAKDAGRLTLNPLAHIDPFGTVMLPLILLIVGGIFIGYAKPVPINPYNFRNPKRDTALVSLAGPGSNFIVAIILGLFIRFFDASPALVTMIPFLESVVYINVLLGLFNLIPVPPLDGSKILMSAMPYDKAIIFERNIGPFGIFLALLIAFMILPYLTSLVFNLIL